MTGRGGLTVLIVGGYGTFGGRLCDLLADEPRLRLIVAGRSLAKAEAFCARPSQAKLVPAVLDRGADDLADAVAGFQPDIVVDASGPWQQYGAAAYRVVEAALAAGADYLDLADGSRFVAGIGAFDSEAKASGRFVLTACSSFPVLTAAAVRTLAAYLARIDTIAAGIAPSPFAGVGINVIRAIASYAGKPVALRRDGQPAHGFGMIDSRNHTITVPGKVPLGPLRYALVDVPDLAVLPAAFPSVQTVFAGAAPQPAILHEALRGLAELVRLGLLPSLRWLAGLMNRAVNTLRWGEHRGGMFVEVTGPDHRGRPSFRRWHMIAEGDAGPLIPSMALETVIRACLEGRRPEAGARVAGREVSLGDYERRFAARGIATAIVGPGEPDAPLYRRLLGEGYGQLSQPVQALHDVGDRSVFRGEAEVTRGRSLLARLVATVVGFPPEGHAVPVTVTLSRDGNREIWARDFDGHRFQSVQALGEGRNEGLLVESFGPIDFAMAVSVTAGRLRLIQRRWSFFGVPMPRWLLPTGPVYEHDAAERFNFHVELTLPLIGPVVTYRGWLVAAG